MKLSTEIIIKTDTKIMKLLIETDMNILIKEIINKQAQKK